MDRPVDCPSRVPVATPSELSPEVLVPPNNSTLPLTSAAESAMIDQKFEESAGHEPFTPKYDISNQEPQMDQKKLDKDLVKFSQESKDLGEVNMVQIVNETAEKPGGLYKYRPTVGIPSFAELHQHETTPPMASESISLLFPGTFDASGRRIPVKEVFSRRQQEILPSASDPMWKQMLHYSQVWSVLITYVDDDARRAELANINSLRMREAWEYAISHGYFGPPNVHINDRREGRRSQQSKEVRKRPIDLDRQPAPFASEGSRIGHMILNRELKKENVSMEQITQRITEDQMQAGEQLLKDMCSLLERDAIELHDWAIVNNLHRFDARSHSRNLLMYCLWEFQRCRQMSANVLLPQLEKASTQKQREKCQERIDIYKQRANEHLALALELNDRRSQESDADEVSEHNGSESDIVRPSRKSTRRTQSTLVIDSSEDEDKDEITSQGTVVQETSSGAECLSFEGEENYSIEAEQPINKTEEDSIEYLPTSGYGSLSQNERDTQVADVPLALVESSKTEAAAGAKPESEATVPDCRSFRYDVTSNQFISEDQIRSRAASLPREDSSSDDYEVENGTGLSINGPSEPIVNNPFIKSLQDYVRNQEQAQSTTSLSRNFEDIKKRKQIYTLQYWQPRVNKMLTDNGYTALKWDLTSWADINAIIQQLNYTIDERNHMIQEFKSGFYAWDRSQMQKTAGSDARNLHDGGVNIIAQPTQASGSETGSISSNSMQSSRGLSFRYSTSATEADRGMIDDMVQDYIEYIIGTKVHRFGYYVVFVNKNDPLQRSVAHGMWALRKDRKAEDATWFYNNLPKPDNFRINEPIINHDWGYSQGPPTKRPKSKAARKQRFEEDDYSDPNFDLVAPINPNPPSQRRIGWPKRKTAHDQPRPGTAKRRRRDEDDGEWRPVN